MPMPEYNPADLMGSSQPLAAPTHTRTSAGKSPQAVLPHRALPVNQCDGLTILPFRRTGIDAQYPHPFAAFRVDNPPKYLSAIHNKGDTPHLYAKYLPGLHCMPVRFVLFAPAPATPVWQPVASVRQPA